MFAEVDRLETLIVAPQGLALDHPQQWDELRSMFRCAFLVDDSHFKTWQAWATPKERIMRKETMEAYLQPLVAFVKRSLEQLNAQPHDAAFVTFDPEHLREVVATRIGTVLVSPMEFAGATLPDIHEINVDILTDVLKEYQAGTGIGFFGEMCARTFGSNALKPGSGNFWLSPKPVGDYPELKDLTRVVTTGRYFASEDPRSEKHPLTRRILRGKDDIADEELINILGNTLMWLERWSPFDLCTRVPPKPGRRDTLGEILMKACKETAGYSDPPLPVPMVNRCDLQLLRCTRSYPKQHQAGGKDNRRENVQGVFECPKAITGPRVVLVDDIYTTGETAAECCRVLLDSGADFVTVVAFGCTQKVITATKTHIRCPNCGSGLRFRCRKRDGAGFWGCPQFYQYNCQGVSLDEGLLRWNSQNRRDNIMLFEDISF